MNYCLDEANTFKDLDHRDGKLFRNRFYLNFDGITSIVEEISKPENYFWKSSHNDAFGRPAHPIRLLVLSSMRILTRNCTLDDMYEATFSPSVIASFFKAYVKWYSRSVTPKVVCMPEADQEAIRSNGAEYIAAGFPWVIVSLDVVHIRLWGCSANLKQVSTEKEKFPSRAFELGCNNRRMIVSATRGFYGSVTDKSIVKFDGAVNSVR